ncbi:MAG: hypothetical protein M1812_002256 [Candelaria pacifica]|nr:MAG: hypothetical protein M1812_002256 [Candelaria pacifica]
MSEDDSYRASTQYRLWSFTPPALASLRSSTNALAADRVRAALKRAREARISNASAPNIDGNGTNTSTESEKELDCLTVDEEQKLLRFFCAKIIEHDFPTNVKVGIPFPVPPQAIARLSSLPTLLRPHNLVKATAVQYMKRFYLSNSPMTYHPKQIMAVALFLSTKTEHHYTSLKAFAAQFPKVTPEEVVAPEFLLTQGLRFTFDVKHPHRGLEGGVMELGAIADGKGVGVPGQAITAKELQEGIFKAGGGNINDVHKRLQKAHGKAKDILKTSALLTDAYFLYTPAQIWLSALLIADEPLALFYVGTKLFSPTAEQVKIKLITTLRLCAELLKSSPATLNPTSEEMEELKRIGKKLYGCQNPEKVDLVGLNQAQKREAEVDEKAVKKRKLERENSMREAESVFGGELGK